LSSQPLAANISKKPLQITFQQLSPFDPNYLSKLTSIVLSADLLNLPNSPAVAAACREFLCLSPAPNADQTLNALGWIVSAGFEPREATKTLASMMNRLGTSWAGHQLSSTYDFGSLTMREFPICDCGACATVSPVDVAFGSLRFDVLRHGLAARSNKSPGAGIA
jgi:hypothetical protein